MLTQVTMMDGVARAVNTVGKTGPSAGALDVLVVASEKDFEITALCLRNLTAYFPALHHLVLVTDAVHRAEELVESLGLSHTPAIPDDQLLSARESRLPGWYRQQIIKLRAGEVFSGDKFCVMSGDTLLARPLSGTDMVSAAGRPFLYVNRYRYRSAHLEYERRRVRAVAELLGATPTFSLTLGDFISDLFCFERDILDVAIQRLQRRHGAEWTRVLDGRSTSAADQERFGEYTLYAVAALELMSNPPPVRVCTESHVLQLHSRNSFNRATFDAPIIHIVDKNITLDEVAERALAFGVDLRPSIGAHR
jgi:hypothetical protein